MVTMGTQGVWAYDLTGLNVPKLSARLQIFSSKVAYSMPQISQPTNVRTHVIDNPRDDGMKQREELWSFQQRYRGAIGKLKSLSETIRPKHNSDLDPFEKHDEEKRSKTGSSNSHSTRSHHRIRRNNPRLKVFHRLPECLNVDRLEGKDGIDHLKEIDRPGIQRMYSSGLIVRNSLYHQIRDGGNRNDQKLVQSIADQKLVQSLERLGPLEKLPDIGVAKVRTGLKSYYGRMGESTIQKRYLHLRRSYSNITDMESTRRKLLLVSKREGQHASLTRLDCIDSNDGEEEQPSYITEAREAADTRENTRRNLMPITRDTHKIDQSTISQTILETDIDVSSSVKQTLVKPENAHSGSVSQLQPTSQPVIQNTSSNRNMQKRNASPRKDNSSNLKSNVTNSSLKPPDTEAEHKTGQRTPSDLSLDIPKERFGSTTHSEDKKPHLRRKPWEWRPNMYRWTDKTVRESDKPYIERVINKGEIIDELIYDSFARTKPLHIPKAND
ncbi:hypothetical protein CHS0354_031611 [Potamilus streckersoni]|uniref:Uncharacterized protein n=1 Tax=Potamilus streckersoni TaxID=2493646 RepID=A0AAE0SHH2_9BIVA|nr:hypothetical protein CHS0354_031611 [Potamilus streckersoni]